MTRSETTKFLSRLLEKSRFSGPGKYWAREVSLDYGYAAGKPRRIDYMQFSPENQCSIWKHSYKHDGRNGEVSQ